MQMCETCSLQLRYESRIRITPIILALSMNEIIDPAAFIEFKPIGEICYVTVGLLIYQGL